MNYRNSVLVVFLTAACISKGMEEVARHAAAEALLGFEAQAGSDQNNFQDELLKLPGLKTTHKLTDRAKANLEKRLQELMNKYPRADLNVIKIKPRTTLAQLLVRNDLSELFKTIHAKKTFNLMGDLKKEICAKLPHLAQDLKLSDGTQQKISYLNAPDFQQLFDDSLYWNNGKLEFRTEAWSQCVRDQIKLARKKEGLLQAMYAYQDYSVLGKKVSFEAVVSASKALDVRDRIKQINNSNGLHCNGKERGFLESRSELESPKKKRKEEDVTPAELPTPIPYYNVAAGQLDATVKNTSRFSLSVRTQQQLGLKK